MQLPVWSAEDLRLSYEHITDKFDASDDNIVFKQFKLLQKRFS